MNSGRFIISFIVAVFLGYPNLHAEQLITFFFRPYPVVNTQEKARRVAKKISNPSKLARQTLKPLLSAKQSIVGIFATYGGFLTASDLNGQVRLPRKHYEPRLSLVITERITPIVRSGNTLSHWELNDDYPAALYHVTKTKDEKTSLEYYEIKKGALPKNNVVPLESILIFAKPRFIYIPEGITLSKQSPHLILPDLYVKRTISITSEALYVLNVMQYFGLLTLLTKKELVY
jgi:hypothetical protein